MTRYTCLCRMTGHMWDHVKIHWNQLSLSTKIMQLKPRGDDCVCSWGAGTFETAAYRCFYFKETTVHPAFHWLWKTKCVPKIKVFGWFLLMDRLNTRNMLKRRHYNIGSTLDCMLCDRHVEETLEHLFFGCSFSQRCWDMLNIKW